MVVVGVVYWWTEFAVGLLIGGLFAAILLLFATLTVTVDDSSIEARFGIGLVRKRVPFDRIQSSSVVRNPWYYGWGIHFIPGGILYNASGFKAVELRLTSGRIVRIGSGEPETLDAVLRRLAPAVADRVDDVDTSYTAFVVMFGIVAA